MHLLGDAAHFGCDDRAVPPPDVRQDVGEGDGDVDECREQVQKVRVVIPAMQ